MIIHLGGGRRGTGDDLPYFRAIISTVNGRGDTIANNWVEASNHRFVTKHIQDDEMDWDEVVTRNTESMELADVYIAEVTTYRLYHGYELMNMLQQKKPVLLVARKSFKQFAISGVHHNLLTMKNYETESDLEAIVNNFLDKYSQITEKSVTIPMDPRIISFLEESEKRSSKSRREILLDLINQGILSSEINS